MGWPSSLWLQKGRAVAEHWLVREGVGEKQGWGKKADGDVGGNLGCHYLFYGVVFI